MQGCKSDDLLQCICQVCRCPIEYGIFGEGSQISTNQKRESTVFSPLIGQNLRPFPENTVHYSSEISALGAP